MVQGRIQVVERDRLGLFLLKVFQELLAPLLAEVVAASYRFVRMRVELTIKNQRQLEELDRIVFALVAGVMQEVLLDALLLDLAEVDGVGGYLLLFNL